MPASAQPATPGGGNDLFRAMTTGLTPTQAPAAPSADLFDMMGPTQTMSSSQSLNFSMSNVQTMSSTGMPLSMSQQVGAFVYTTENPATRALAKRCCQRQLDAVGKVLELAHLIVLVDTEGVHFLLSICGHNLALRP